MAAVVLKNVKHLLVNRDHQPVSSEKLTWLAMRFTMKRVDLFFAYDTFLSHLLDG
jgi:hypothetical protein